MTVQPPNNDDPISSGFYQRLDHEAGYASRVSQLVMDAEDEAQLVDLLEVITTNASLTAATKKDTLVELENETEGHRYMMSRGGKNERTYNWTTLLSKFMDATTFRLLDLLVYLRQEDIIRISWQWSNLQNAARRFDVDLVIANREITDGDSADVGLNWVTGSPKFTKKEE